MNQMLDNNAHVRASNLSVNFGSVDVLNGLNLDIQKGEFLVLLGSSGCGKSTLLNTFAGLQDATSGQIWIDGRNVTWEEPKDRGIAMVFQSYALYPKMTVRGNLSFALKMNGTPKRKVSKLVEDAARVLQIEHLLDRRPSELSGGQRQRVAIGRALVRHVDVFLFDEPLSNLDAKLRAELRVELKRLHRELGATMIYVTHDQVEALTLADRIAAMKDGVIQQLACPDDIYNRPANRFVAQFIGLPSMNFFKGRVIQKDGKSLFSSPELTLSLDDYEAAAALVEGHEVELGIRPEHVLLLNDPSGIDRGLLGVVDLVEMLGSEQIVWVVTESSRFCMRVPPDEKLHHGEKVAVQFRT
ncbi:MAG: ABC transporter ATP-binding protein, partial [Pseudomonadota bacterium]